ncbi:syntaxin-8 isoform X1 [Hirundo rustica]|uniref:syntaxin-8 isoform X1 n=1 Tax=Hirundo rustica TaxID=43150 RepID=UPI001A94E242|nr:syntaxin-8 isoform X1 [Hirundo rustica]
MPAPLGRCPCWSSAGGLLVPTELLLAAEPFHPRLTETSALSRPVDALMASPAGIKGEGERIAGDHRRPHQPGGEHGRPAAHPDTAREDGGQEIHVLRDAGGDRAAAHRHRRGRALAHGLTPTAPERLLQGSAGLRGAPCPGQDLCAGTSSILGNQLLCWERAPSLGISSSAGNELHPWESAPLLGTSSILGNQLHSWEGAPSLGISSSAGNELHPWESAPLLGRNSILGNQLLCWEGAPSLGINSTAGNELHPWESTPQLGTSSILGNQLLCWERAPSLEISSSAGNELHSGSVRQTPSVLGAWLRGSVGPGASQWEKRIASHSPTFPRQLQLQDGATSAAAASGDALVLLPCRSHIPKQRSAGRWGEQRRSCSRVPPSGREEAPGMVLGSDCACRTPRAAGNHCGLGQGGVGGLLICWDGYL